MPSDFSRRQKIGLVVFGVVLFFAVITGLGMAENFLSSTFYSTGCSATCHVNASDGPEVLLIKDYSMQEGQPFTAKSFNLSTESNGWMNISTLDADSSTMVVTVNEINGTWTIVSSIDSPNSNITFQPSDKNFTRAGSGGIDMLNFSEVKVDDGDVDFNYSASSQGTIVVETNGSDGTQYGMVDPDTLEGLDVAIANADGTIPFVEVPSATNQDVRIEELGTLEIRNEQPDHALVTGCKAEVKFFEQEDDDPTIELKEDTNQDGKIDLTGLPVDESFVVDLKCAQQHNRTVIIEDLSQQQTAFLLNSTEATTNEVTFDVDDNTGDFSGSKTDIIIQKAINRSKYNGEPAGFSWTNVGGDNLGADSSYTIDLEHEHRYRIKVRNDEGDTRILGSYVSNADETVTLEIGNVVIDPEGTDQPAWAANYTNDSASTANTVHFEYNDSRQNTTTLYVEIFNRSDETDHLFANTSFNDVGEVSVSQDVPAGEEDTEWVVKFVAKRSGDDANFKGKEIVGPRERQLTGMADWLVALIFLGTIWIVAGLFSQLNGHIGGLVVAGLGAIFFFMGFVPSALGAGVMILSLVTAAIIFVNEARGTAL